MWRRTDDGLRDLNGGDQAVFVERRHSVGQVCVRGGTVEGVNVRGEGETRVDMSETKRVGAESR